LQSFFYLFFFVCPRAPRSRASVPSSRAIDLQNPMQRRGLCFFSLSPSFSKILSSSQASYPSSVGFPILPAFVGLDSPSGCGPGTRHPLLVPFSGFSRFCLRLGPEISLQFTLKLHRYKIRRDFKDHWPKLTILHLYLDSPLPSKLGGLLRTLWRRSRCLFSSDALFSPHVRV